MMDFVPSAEGTCGRLVIFTDLDGTLIDFETYSAELTTPLVKRLMGLGHQVVFCSSKTLSEQRALMQQMQIDTPGIVENGSGLYLPASCGEVCPGKGRELEDGGRLIPFGRPAGDIRVSVDEVSRETGIDLRSYTALADEELVAITGLSTVAARRARQRDFSETLTAQLSTDRWREVEAAFAKHDLQCLCGGRFHTVSVRGCDKGTALRMTLEAFAAGSGDRPTAIAIGDSHNDADMLKTADLAYLVQQPDGAWCDVDVSPLRRMSAVGPAGWLWAVRDAFELKLPTQG